MRVVVGMTWRVGFVTRMQFAEGKGKNSSSWLCAREKMRKRAKGKQMGAFGGWRGKRQLAAGSHAA